METNLISGTLHSLKLQKNLAVNQLNFPNRNLQIPIFLGTSCSAVTGRR